jgi:DNA polymerase V
MSTLSVSQITPLEDAGSLELPFVHPSVSAGFPSPAENYFEERIDLTRQLVRNPVATFLVRVEGNSMIDAGIFHNDVLIVDRSIKPRSDSIVVTTIDGELAVKRLQKKNGRLWLQPENPDYPPIEITEATDYCIWGVAVYSIHTLD